MFGPEQRACCSSSDDGCRWLTAATMDTTTDAASSTHDAILEDFRDIRQASPCYYEGNATTRLSFDFAFNLKLTVCCHGCRMWSISFPLRKRLRARWQSHHRVAQPAASWLVDTQQPLKYE